MQKTETENKSEGTVTGASLRCTLYTDPLCCWSWAMEPQLAKLKAELGEHAQWITKMGGLIPSWNNFHDESNSVSRPVQMGPVWMHAATIANKPIRHELWLKDAPASSYPACIAVKSAQLQSAQSGEVMLEMLRSAAMEEGLNIAKPEIIYEVAQKVANVNPLFDLEQFTIDYNGNPASEAFKQDLQEINYYRINRFPSLLVRTVHDKTILLKGYRTYEDMRRELGEAFPATIVNLKQTLKL